MVDKQKNSNESTVATLSILMLVVVSAAIIMMVVQVEDSGQQGESVTLEDFQSTTAPFSIPDERVPQQADATSPAADGSTSAAASPQTPEEKRLAEITSRFEQAVVMLHAKEYEHAATALHRVMELSPRMPEVYVNMGYAKLGQALPQEALVFFETATQLKPEQANAYWGMAVALESSGDLAGALGAMRTFIHLSPGNDNFARRARSALWEWEEALARGPLPQEEKAFLERGALQWESRNTPQDTADSGEQPLQVQPIP